jgi:hypothetical protein
MSSSEPGHAAHRSRVLVAIMNSRRDFEIARDQGWYRIPYDRAPTRVGADFLAFYQTKDFGDERWAVNYYSPIRRYRLALRRTLLPNESEHPKANSLYYKIEIGPLLRLPHPIPSARLRRITFIPTTVERLLQAQEVNDLWRGGLEEEELWLAFKESGFDAERRYPLREQDPEYCVDFALFCKRGKIAVCVESAPDVENVPLICERSKVEEYDMGALGWTLVSLSSEELTRARQTCLDRVRETVDRQGGLVSQSGGLAV